MQPNTLRDCSVVSRSLIYGLCIFPGHADWMVFPPTFWVGKFYPPTWMRPYSHAEYFFTAALDSYDPNLVWLTCLMPHWSVATGAHLSSVRAEQAIWINEMAGAPSGTKVCFLGCVSSSRCLYTILIRMTNLFYYENFSRETIVTSENNYSCKRGTF